MAAAIASVQMDRLDAYIGARRRNAKALTEAISPMKGVELRQEPTDRTHVWYLYTVFLSKKRDEVMKKLRARGVGAAAYWETPVNKMPLYEQLGLRGEEAPHVGERRGSRPLAPRPPRGERGRHPAHRGGVREGGQGLTLEKGPQPRVDARGDVRGQAEGRGRRPDLQREGEHRGVQAQARSRSSSRWGPG